MAYGEEFVPLPLNSYRNIFQKSMRTRDCFQSSLIFPKVVMHPDGVIDGFKKVLAKLFQLLAL